MSEIETKDATNAGIESETPTADGQTEARTQPFERHVFPNGLQMLTKEVHSAPVVSFWVWYRVGSRNEHEGITGVSHWVEHMMFKGTNHFGKGQIMQQVAENGGTLNAFTSFDYTAYFETLPSDRLDLAIQIESDRIANSLFDPEEVNSERTVIISEREGSENEPDYMLDEEVNALAFKVHTYRNGIIGWKSDLRAITRDDLYNHYKTYYAPNNATVVVVGDFDTQDVLKKVADAFGVHEAKPAPPTVRALEPPQVGERRVVVKQPGPTAQLEIVYHSPAAANPDIYPLMVCDALLSGAKPMGMGGGGMGRSSRLYKALVSTQIASSAGSYFGFHKDPHLFTVAASAKPGDDYENDLKRIESALLEEIRKLQEDEIPSEELEKAVRQSRAQFIYASDSVSSQAYMLGFLEMVFTADVYSEILDRLAAITPDDVRRVAKTYLVEQNRTVGWFIPNNPE